MPNGTPCEVCGKPAIRRGSAGRFPKYCSDGCEYKARYQRTRAERVANRPVLQCQCCGKAMAGVRPDRKYCRTACQAYENRRKRGVVKENIGVCSSCLKPLVGQRSNAEVCKALKCQRWAYRHPGVPHPSTQPRQCGTCGESIDHLNGKAKYCSKTCTDAACRERNRDMLNARKREAWASGSRKESHKAYRKANADRYRQYQRIARAKDPERFRAYYTKWLADPANYQIVVFNGYRRRALEESSPGSVGIDATDWIRLVRRYRNCCAYCGKFVKRPTIDHVIPVIRGGRHAIGNVLPACGKCNSSKGGSLLVEWRRRQRQDAAA